MRGINSIPPRRLLFSGGGIRVISCLGALQVLQEKNIVKCVREYCGVSAGALAAGAAVHSPGSDLAAATALLHSGGCARGPGGPGALVRGDEGLALHALSMAGRRSLGEPGGVRFVDVPDGHLHHGAPLQAGLARGALHPEDGPGAAA